MEESTNTERTHESIEVANTEVRSAWQRPGLWVAVALTVMVVLWVMMSGEDKHTSSTDTSTDAATTQAVNDELRANMAKLTEHLKQTEQRIQAMNPQAQAKSPQFTARVNRQTSPPPLSDAEQKALAMRQNMPSNMYSANAPTAVSADNHNDNTREATFAGHDAYSTFGNQVQTTTVVAAKKMAHPADTIAEGELLHGVLETPINSDLPGMVRAVVTQPIYAYTGNSPLIPAGARLIGQYASMVRGGQDRAFVIWNRVLLPNGVSVALNSPGADRLGRGGMGADSIDHHFFERFGNATLLSVIGAGTANVGVNADDRYNSAAAYRQAIAESFQQSASQALDDASDIKNTLNINQGKRITVFVAHDLSFYQVFNEDHEHA